MRIVVGLLFVLVPIASVHAQSKRPVLCAEEMAFRLKDHIPVDGTSIDTVASRKFSLVWSAEFLNLITAGRTDFYECQNIIPRLNEGGPRNTVKCQNGIYFITVDLVGLKFVRAKLNPQTPSDVEIAYGSCKPI